MAKDRATKLLDALAKAGIAPVFGYPPALLRRRALRLIREALREEYLADHRPVGAGVTRSTYLQRAASLRLQRAEWLREARTDRNLSLREMGEILGGVSPATLSRVERGYIPSALVAGAIDLWLDDDDDAEATR